MKNILVMIFLVISFNSYSQYKTTKQSVSKRTIVKNSKTTEKKMYDPNEMISTLVYTCNVIDAGASSNGWTLSVLRYFHRPTDIGFKIQLSYHTIVKEYCSLVRKNILARTYGGRGFSFIEKTRTAKVGDYCNSNNNGWLTGLVYEVTYPSQNPNAGIMFTTHLGHKSSVEADIQNIGQLISMYNTMRESHTPFLSCASGGCENSIDNPVTDFDSDNPIDKGMVREHREFLGKTRHIAIQDSVITGPVKVEEKFDGSTLKETNIKN